MEHKSSREKAWVASKTKKNNVIANDESYSEINNLQDDSFVEAKEEVVLLTEEEKLEIRKKIGFLLIFVFIAFILMIIILIFDPFTPKKNKKRKDNEVPVVQEKSLYDYEDGKISLTDKYVVEIYNEIEYKLADYYEYDTYFLYRNENTNMNSLTDLEKTILVSKSNNFNSIISNISTSTNICEEEIVVDSNDISKISLNKYGTTINPVSKFKYNYYYSNSYITSILFTLKDGKYIGKCYEHGKNITKVVEQKLVNVTKETDNLYVDVQVVFITKDGVFKDPNHKELITNNEKTSSNEYMSKGRIYRYNYIITDDGYYLNNVSLLK